MLFGAIMLPEAVNHVSWIYIIYALMSLTFIRMVPVMISLIGKGLTIPTLLYLGWFGPRGVASILYVLLVVDKNNLGGEKIIFTITAFTVLLSIFLHGMTAVPVANAYASKIDEMPPHVKHLEIKKVRHLPTRVKHIN